jgi:malate synthase
VSGAVAAAPLDRSTGPKTQGVSVAMDRIEIAGLKVDAELHRFVEDEALVGTGVSSEDFWTGLSQIIHDLAPENRGLLARRDALQARIDDWHRANPGPVDLGAYKSFLQEIGYLVPEGEAFSVTTENVDPEIATLAGRSSSCRS